MKIEIIECTLVFLVPLFIACMLNSYSKKNVRANLKVVFYRFFLFCIILFFASQIPIQIEESSSLIYVIRGIGDILMAMLIFEFFMVPNVDTHPDDIALIHNSVLWLVVFIFLAMCCFNHYPDISIEEKGWRLHPIFDVITMCKKLYNERSLPLENSNLLPACNLFSYATTIAKSK